jgi:hypothetical protein
MRVQTILISVVSGIFLVSGTGVFGAESSSSSAVPTLEVVSIDPPSPAILEAGQKVTVKVRYDMGDCEAVVIWVRSIRSSVGVIAHDSSTIHRTNGQTGTMEGYFYFNKKAEAKDISVTMTDVNKHADVCRVTRAVDYQWLSPPAPNPPVKFEGITQIPGSYTWDIDSDTIGGNSKFVDLWFQVEASREPSLVARNNASMAILVIPFKQIGLDKLRECFGDPRPGQKEISSSKGRYRLQPGLCFGLKTSEGRIAKLELLEDDFPKCLVFRWQLYPEVVSRETESRKPIKTDSAKQYGGLWYYADPWGRPDDRIVVLEGQFDNRKTLSFSLLKHFCSSKPAFAEAVVRKDQIDIRFNEVQYADRNSSDKTMSYSLLYHEGTLLGQVFRDGLEPEKVVMRRLDATMGNQIITSMGRECREMQSRFERELTQAASEKLALKNNLESLEKTQDQLRSENAELSASLSRARKEIEDMAASWDRAKTHIAELQRDLTQVQQTNRGLADQNEKVLKTVEALEDMLRQANVTKPD